MLYYSLYFFIFIVGFFDYFLTSFFKLIDGSIVTDFSLLKENDCYWFFISKGLYLTGVIFALSKLELVTFLLSRESSSFSNSYFFLKLFGYLLCKFLTSLKIFWVLILPSFFIYLTTMLSGKLYIWKVYYLVKFSGLLSVIGFWIDFYLFVLAFWFIALLFYFELRMLRGFLQV